MNRLEIGFSMGRRIIFPSQFLLLLRLLSSKENLTKVPSHFLLFGINEIWKGIFAPLFRLIPIVPVLEFFYLIWFDWRNEIEPSWVTMKPGMVTRKDNTRDSPGGHSLTMIITHNSNPFIHQQPLVVIHSQQFCLSFLSRCVVLTLLLDA